MTVKALLVDFSHMYYWSTIDISDFYLHREHLKSFRNNNNIVSKRGKEAGVVILNKKYYNKRMVNMHKDTTKFKIPGRVDELDKSAIEEQWIQRELLWFYNDHLIQKKIMKKYARFDH